MRECSETPSAIIVSLHIWRGKRINDFAVRVYNVMFYEEKRRKNALINASNDTDTLKNENQRLKEENERWKESVIRITNTNSDLVNSYEKRIEDLLKEIARLKEGIPIQNVIKTIHVNDSNMVWNLLRNRDKKNDDIISAIKQLIADEVLILNPLRNGAQHDFEQLLITQEH